MKYGLAILLIFVAGTAWAVSDFVVPHTWRYKITVEIETPEGIKTGSAVREVRAWKNITKFINPDVRDVIYEVRGEAVVIDLDEHGVLFLLIGSNNQVQRAFHESSLTSLIQLPEGKKAELKGDHTFVFFRNINDPKSIETLKSSNFSRTFNEKITLKRIIIEITKNPVTFGSVKKYLNWIGEKPMGLRFADPDIKDPAKYLTKSSFIRKD